jgi:hypothetical protein
MTKPLTVADLIRAGQFDAAVERMQELCRIQDPEVPVDVDEVREQYEAVRARLNAVVPPTPFKITVQMMKARK